MSDGVKLVRRALRYAKRGLRVLPLHSIRPNGACTCADWRKCKRPGKHPRTLHGVHDATTDPATIRRWWEHWPNANIGIATGEGLCVLDVDKKSGGLSSLKDLESRHGSVANNPTVMTGGGGLHVYFSDSTGRIRSSNGTIADGIDVKASGGYVVAPPSVHVSGTRYRWRLNLKDVELHPAPDWLNGDASVRRRTRTREALPKGQRNDALTRIGGALVRQGLSHSTVEAVLRATNATACDPPLGRDEVSKIARSVGRYRAKVETMPSGRHVNHFVHELDAAAALHLFDRPSHLAIVRVLCERAVKAHTIVVSMGDRAIAEEAVVSLGLASQALRDLEVDGWVEKVQEHVGEKAAQYRLCIPEWTTETILRTETNPPHPPSGLKCSTDCTGVCRNLWEHRVLGKKTQQVFELLSSDPNTVDDLAKVLGVSKRAVYHHLEKLQRPSFGNSAECQTSFALILSTPNGWCRSEHSPCDVAEALGIRQRRARKTEMFDAQRRRFRGDSD